MSYIEKNDSFMQIQFHVDELRHPLMITNIIEMFMTVSVIL